MDDPERQIPLGAADLQPSQVLHLRRDHCCSAQVDDTEQRLPIGATGFRPAEVLHLRCHHCGGGGAGGVAPGRHHLPGLQHEEDDEGQQLCEGAGGL